MVEVTRLNVVLVHGTWGRGFWRCCRKPTAGWCEAEASFVVELKRAVLSQLPGVQLTVDAFAWSGSNSVFEREKAAGRLAVRLSALGSGDGRTLIVAHSHGGNVALKAISAICDSSRTYLCTLATPFLSIVAVDRRLPHSPILLRLVAATSVVAALYFLFPFSFIDHVLALLLCLMLFTTGTEALYWLLTRAFANTPAANAEYPSFWKNLLYSADWQQRPERLADATAWDARVLSGRLLVLRGVDDEAALTLAAGAIVNRVTRAAYRWSSTILFGFVGFIAYILTIKALELFSVNYAKQFVSSSMPILLVSILIGLFLPSLARMVFGNELGAGAMRCDILFDSVPDIDDVDVKTVGIGLKNSGLVHSLHEVPEVPKSIAAWLSDRILSEPSTQQVS